MRGGSNPLSSVSRPRTRNQWDDHYKNLYIEKKRNNDGESGYNRDGGKSWEKHGFVIIGEKRRCVENIISLGRRASKRTRNFIKDSASPSNVRGKEKSDVRSNTGSGDNVSKSDDDEVEFVSNVSSSDDVGSTGVGVDNVGNGGKRGRGRPRKKPLEQPKHISNDVCVDLEKFTDSSKNSDDSETETTSEEEDEFSDEDYRASSSESSDVPYYGSDDEQEKDDAGENEKMMNVEEDDNSSDTIGDKTALCLHRKNGRVEKKKENDIQQENDNESDEGYNRVDHDINDDGEFPSVRNSSRKCGKRESEVEQGREDEIDKGCHEIHDDSCCNKACANWKIKDGEKFPSTRKSKIIDWKTDGDLAGLSRIYESRSSYNSKEDLSLAECYRPSTFSKSQKKDDKFKSSRDEDSCRYIERVVERDPKFRKKEFKLSKKKTSSRARAFDLIKILVESINSVKEHQSHSEENVLTRSALPLRFKFEDEVPPPHVKSDWEKEIDSLFCDLELGLLESETDCTNSSVMKNDDISTEIDQSPAACCARGEHQPILDEQIGIICKYCFTVILEIKYVLPPFYTPPSGRQDRKDYDESQSPSYFVDQIQFQDSGYGTRESTYRSKGTVWDLIPGVEKELYPHQREGFEFMFKNIAGNIVLEKMKYPLPGGRGCIISHAPGTGKTRLAIVFLQTFLKLYPTCRPVIIAPKGMLLTWESEFVKWNVNIPFHNLNKKELSENENAFAAEILGQVSSGVSGPMSIECMRLIKLASWVFGRSILGVSYQLFKNLVRENGEKGGLKDQFKKLLLECPGLLVLDEGHTPRNENSQIWKALSKVATQRRVILSGTPFQNNLAELFNTLCIVNPRFVNEIESGSKTGRETRGWKSRRAGRKKWMEFTSSIGLDTDDGLKKLRAMLDPFVHVHKGTILKESLPGLRDTLVFLHPTELQKVLLEASSKTRNIFHRIRQVSLVSVHPSLMVATSKSSALKSNLEKIESVDAGVKTKFVMKLIRLADALGERVLIFSQFLDPLEFIRKQIKSRFSWNEGRELLYMNGQLDERQRQDSISSFNDDTSEAKVLLASERACSEGINLVGASRVVLLDTVWNPSVEKQAVSRAYRLGQKKVVYVYRLFTSGTEVKQYAQQIHKERISQLLFSAVDGQTCHGDESLDGSEDKVLEAMLGLERFNCIFEKIIRQPKESDLIEIFGLVDRN